MKNGEVENNCATILCYLLKYAHAHNQECFWKTPDRLLKTHGDFGRMMSSGVSVDLTGRSLRWLRTLYFFTKTKLSVLPFMIFFPPLKSRLWFRPHYTLCCSGKAACSDSFHIIEPILYEVHWFCFPLSMCLKTAIAIIN